MRRRLDAEGSLRSRVVATRSMPRSAAPSRGFSATTALPPTVWRVTPSLAEIAQSPCALSSETSWRAGGHRYSSTRCNASSSDRTGTCRAQSRLTRSCHKRGAIADISPGTTTRFCVAGRRVPVNLSHGPPVYLVYLTAYGGEGQCSSVMTSTTATRAARPSTRGTDPNRGAAEPHPCPIEIPIADLDSHPERRVKLCRS